jgi:BACON domain-containing protein
MNDLSPCIDWAEKLALKPEDLAPSEYAALNAHLATCSACVAVSTDYHILTDRMRARPVPAVRPLPQLLPELFYLQEDQKKSTIPADTPANGKLTRIPSSRITSRRRTSSRSTVLIIGILRPLAAVLILVVILSGYGWIFEHYRPTLGGSVPPLLPAHLAIKPGYLDFGTVDTSARETAQIEISNTGEHALNWHVDPVWSQAFWLVLSKSAGTLAPGTHEWITAKVSLVNMKGIRYATSLLFVSNGGNVNVLVNASVQCILTSPEALSFAGTSGKGDPPPQSLAIISCSGTGTWSATVNTSENASWLSLSQVSGLLENGKAQSVLININLAGLATGSYSGHILFTLGSASTLVTVNLTVH